MPTVALSCFESKVFYVHLDDINKPSHFTPFHCSVNITELLGLNCHPDMNGNCEIRYMITIFRTEEKIICMKCPLCYKSYKGCRNRSNRYVNFIMVKLVFHNN